MHDEISVEEGPFRGTDVLDDDDEEAEKEVAQRCASSEELKLVVSPSSLKLFRESGERGLGSAPPVNTG